MNRSESSRIPRLVEKQLNAWFPSEENRSMILGVSGGPDSMTLMYLFSKLKVDLTVVHCNYQLRGKDSDADQHLVEETASMWGFDAVSVRLDPDEGNGENFQNWARSRRYEIFRDLKKETGSDAIVTAHHQDDQLETIIQKILRGSGMTAWQGMKIWNGELFRPLLDVSKAGLLQFASANHIPYRLDGSNEESTYARNFLRNGWFPILDDLFPGWRENILKVPERAKEHEAVVKSLIRFLKTDERSMMRERLISLPSEVQKPLILQVLKSIDPDITISSGALKNLDKLEMLQTGKKLAVNNQWSLIRDRDHFTVIQEVSEKSHTESSAEIQEESIAEEYSRKALEKPVVHPAGLYLYVTEWDEKIEPDRLQIDADRIKWPLNLREWESGDSINPLGMEGSQNISDLLTNEKISVADKSYVRIAESFDGKIFAVIFPPESQNEKTGTIANWARCTDGTKSVLLIGYQ